MVRVPLLLSGVATLLRLARPARRPLLMAVGLATAATAADIAPLYAVYLVVVTLPAGSASSAGLMLVGCVTLAVLLARHLLWGRAMFLSHRAAFDVIRHLRIQIADRLTAVPLGRLGRRHHHR